MFGFLKKKLQEAVNSFTKKAEESKTEEPIKEPPVIEKKTQKSDKEETIVKKKKEELKEQKKDKTHEKKKEEKKTEDKLQEVKKLEEIEKELDTEKKKQENILSNESKPSEEKGFLGLFKKKQTKEEKKQEKHPTQVEKKGFFEVISDTFTKVSLSEQKFEELFWDLEIALLENNVAVEVIEKIKSDLKSELVDKKLPRNNLEKEINNAIRKSIEGLFINSINLVKEAKKKKPFIILVIGINGSGKTTSIAKLVHLFKKNNLDCVIGACDTFRAAAIQQLEEHASKLGVKVIKHDYGSDPSAVAFDAIEHAKAKNKDVVLIDTAGRLHSNSNLMAELEKIVRVAKPDFKIFVGESIAGNDVIEQVKLFNSKIGIDGIILAKADVDEKGGAAISASFVTGKPILYLGTGQNYEDLKEFDKKIILESIL